jgi:hypothetical protein
MALLCSFNYPKEREPKPSYPNVFTLQSLGDGRFEINGELFYLNSFSDNLIDFISVANGQRLTMGGDFTKEIIEALKELK